MRVNFKYFLIVIISFFISCKKPVSSISEKEKLWKLTTKNDSIIVIEWKQFEDDSVKLKIPKNWEIVKNSDSWKSFEDNKSNSFSMMKYDVSKIGMSDKVYVKESFKDISGLIEEGRYHLKRLSFKNGKSCYIMTYYYNRDNIDYVLYNIIYQPENLIYDITFKTKRNENLNPVHYRQFLLMAQSLEYNHDLIMDGDNLMIDSEKEIKIEDL